MSQGDMLGPEEIQEALLAVQQSQQQQMQQQHQQQHPQPHQQQQQRRQQQHPKSHDSPQRKRVPGTLEYVLFSVVLFFRRFCIYGYKIVPFC